MLGTYASCNAGPFVTPLWSSELMGAMLQLLLQTLALASSHVPACCTEQKPYSPVEFCGSGFSVQSHVTHALSFLGVWLALCVTAMPLTPQQDYFTGTLQLFWVEYENTSSSLGTTWWLQSHLEPLDVLHHSSLEVRCIDPSPPGHLLLHSLYAPAQCGSVKSLFLCL